MLAKKTHRGLGRSGELASELRPGNVTCPPPSSSHVPPRRPSLVVSRPVRTLRRHASKPIAIDVADLAALVLVTKASVPRVRTRANLVALPLEPREAFVFSRIDGLLTAEELADLVGMTTKELVGIVRKMHDLGLLEV